MAKEITIRMSTASINDAIKELRRIKEDFERKLDLFVRMLANDGVQIALMEIRSAVADTHNADIELTIDSKQDIVSATIQMFGEDRLFIEFGAGFYYNPADPPHASQYNMGVGTFPGQTHAFDIGWWYTDKDGKSRYTHGTQATSPMLHASNNYRNNAILMALQLFRS